MDTSSDTTQAPAEACDGLEALKTYMISSYNVPRAEVERAVADTGASWAPVPSHQWEYTFSQGGPKQRSLKTAGEVLVRSILQRTFATGQEPAQSDYKQELDDLVQAAPDPSGAPAETCCSAIIQRATEQVRAKQESLYAFRNIKEILPLWSMPSLYFKRPEFCMWYFGILSLPEARMFALTTGERERAIRKLRSCVHPDKFPNDNDFYTTLSQVINSAWEEVQKDSEVNVFGRLPYSMTCPEIMHSCMVHRLCEDLADANQTINSLRAQQSDTRHKLEGLQASYRHFQDASNLKAANINLKRNIDCLVDSATELYMTSKRMQRAAV